jgi:hypothetical protein
MAADDPLVQRALDRLASLNVEVARLKRFINEADRLNEQAPRFPEVDEENAASIMPLGAGAAAKRSKKWNPGAFFNTPLSTAVRRILEARAEAAAGEPSPASVDEIYTSLCEGSFAFDSSGVEPQKNGIRISLGKNSVTFVKLPNSDLFGLVEWYGARPRKTGPKKTNGQPSTSAAGAGEEAAGDAAAEVAQSEVMEDQKQP